MYQQILREPNCENPAPTQSFIMNMVLSLQNDPDFQEILKDPAIINAVNSGDTNTLISNPKFMKLLTNPKFQKIKKSRRVVWNSVGIELIPMTPP